MDTASIMDTSRIVYTASNMFIKDHGHRNMVIKDHGHIKNHGQNDKNETTKMTPNHQG